MGFYICVDGFVVFGVFLFDLVVYDNVVLDIEMKIKLVDVMKVFGVIKYVVEVGFVYD